MENMTNIEWKKEYDTGIVLIDKQHRNLVEIINNLNEAKIHNKEKTVLRETILKLADYTKYHFEYEETHMIQNGFHNITQHKEQHGIFIKKMIEILTELKNEDYEHLTENLLEFLTDWTMNHIIHEDKSYGDFYLEKQNAS